MAIGLHAPNPRTFAEASRRSESEWEPAVFDCVAVFPQVELEAYYFGSPQSKPPGTCHLGERYFVATTVVRSAGEMRTPKRSHQMITL
jgi:hypothetical protein